MLFKYDDYEGALAIDGVYTQPSRIDDNAVYNLKGQRVDDDQLTPGIYIRNGKKFVVK